MLISAPHASPAVVRMAAEVVLGSAMSWCRQEEGGATVLRWPTLGVCVAVVRCLLEAGFFSGRTIAGSAPTWKTWLRDPSEQDNGSFFEAVLLKKKVKSPVVCVYSAQKCARQLQPVRI